MDEESKVKKRLLKNTILNLVTFSIIFYIFGTVIYNQFYNSLYASADEELEKFVSQQQELENLPKQRIGDDFNEKDELELESKENSISKSNNAIGDKEIQNPRLICIERDENGNVVEINSVSNTNFYEDVDFDENSVNIIYEISVGGYSYRGINYKTKDNTFIQALINTDSEKDIADNFKKILIIAIIICVVLILIASYILSRKTLNPIIDSWKRQNKFVSDASHELRTPLTIIKAKQEALLEKPESKIIDNAEDISATLKETQRLTKLVKELMELARNDSREMELNKEKFYLDDEIKSIIGLYSDVAKTQNKNLKLSLNYNEEIYADENKLKEVLIILLDNSLKYTEENDYIEVKTYKKDNKCIIEVIDTGIGISKEDQDHIFERFYRAEKSRTREKGGMGLGLSIAYNIVKLHKGIIRVDKNMTKGTKMIVKLPIK